MTLLPTLLLTLIYLFSALAFSAGVYRTSNPVFGVLSFIMVILHVVIALFFIQRAFFAFLIAIIYIGAIVVLFLFVTMMLLVRTSRSEASFSTQTYYKRLIVGGAFSVSLYILFGTAFGTEVVSTFSSFFSAYECYTNYASVIVAVPFYTSLAVALFTTYSLITLVLTLLMLVGIIVAIAGALSTPREFVFMPRASGAISSPVVGTLRSNAAETISHWNF